MSRRLARDYRKEGITQDEEGQVSRMVNCNDALTVTQLIDIVAFLQAHYKLEPYEPP